MDEKVRTWVRRSLVSVVVIVALVTVGITLVLPRLTGGAALTVLTGSMTPTYPVGSIVVVRPVTPADIRVGDVITFAANDSLTTHRVTAIEEGAGPDGTRLLTTKGDANRGEDLDPVVEPAVRGRVWFHVPVLGYLRQFLSSASGLAVLAIVALGAGSAERVTTTVRRWRGDRPVEDQTPEEPPAPPPASRPREHAFVPDVAVPRPSSDAGQPLECGLMLLRLEVGPLMRGQVLELVGVLRAHVLSISRAEVVIAVVGNDDELVGAVQLFTPYNIAGVSRAATVTLAGKLRALTAEA